ncbi:MAG: ABC transporter substrate-binding protein [Xanthobacteraceae bacterium]
MMRRRTVMMLLGGAAAAWPLAAPAQEQKPSVVGYLDTYTAESTGAFLEAFRKGLSESGYIEGRNVTTEYRYANNQLGRLPELAADLVRRRVAVIVTPFGTGAALAAKKSTSTIPILFLTSTDPVQEGLVTSFNQPGGNVTGLSTMNVELGAKRLGLLRELFPEVARIVALINPKSSIAESLTQEALAAASAIGRQIEMGHASTSNDIEAVFARVAQKGFEALLVSSDQFFTSRRVQFALLAAHYRIPTVYSYRLFAEAGGLMSYGPSLTSQYRQLGV